MSETLHTVSASTIIGPGKNGTVNQDYHYWASENGTLVAAVADGAGSLELSHIGATLAAQTACEETLDAIHDGCSFEEAIVKGFECAREALLERDDWKKLGCTLSVTIVGEEGWVSGSVGDAFTVVLGHDGNLTTVQAPRESEFANITKLLTSKGIEPTIESHDEIPAGFAVSSDGLLRLSTEASGAASAGFWLPLFSRVEQDTDAAEKFLQWLNHNAHLDDDTTLIMVKL